MKRPLRTFCIIMLLSAAVILGYRFWPRPPLPPAAKATRVLVVKHSNQMFLYDRDRLLKEYRVSLGQNPGPKERQGDKRTPEGMYRIARRNPESGFYKALVISYPNPRDIDRAARMGIQDPGGLIEIHGLMPKLAWVGGIHNLIDYTKGCIAVTNEEMDELWSALEVGTPIEIRP